MAEKQATFGVKVAAESNASEAAQGVEELRARLTASQDAIKNYSNAMRGLRGSSAEVVAARQKFKSALDAEKDSVSRGVVALGKLGTTLGAANAKAKESSKSTTGVRDAVSATGGPLAEMVRGLDTIGTLMASGEAAAVGLAGGAATLAAAVAASTVAVIAGTVSLASWILEQGSALRTMGLFREAATGSAENAEAFGSQIEELGERIATPRAELSALTAHLGQALRGFRVTGEGMNDAFHAIAQESAAMGAQAGAAIENIITRGKRMGRLQVTPLDLDGTGLKFDELAAHIGKAMGVSMQVARNQLYMGRIDLSKGAAGIRSAVEAQFASINLRRMLDINVIALKFKETLSSLVTGVRLEPILDGFKFLADLFKDTSVTGRILKGLISDIGNGLGKAFLDSLPLIKDAFLGVEIAALKFELSMFDVRDALRKGGFGSTIGKDIDVVALAVKAGDVVFTTAAVSVISLTTATAAMASPFVTLAYVVDRAVAAMKDFDNAIKTIDWDYLDRKLTKLGESLKIDWTPLGKDAGAGIELGFSQSSAGVEKSVSALADRMKNTFTTAFDMHSPSRVTAGWGRNIDRGIALGLDSEAPNVQRAVDEMMPSSPAINRSLTAAAPSSAAGGGAVTISVNAVFPNAQNGAEIAATLSGPSFRSLLTRAIEELALGAGVPTQQAAST